MSVGIDGGLGDVTAEARGVLSGAFRLMWTLRRADGPIGLTAVAQRSGVPKSTAHRLLSQLVQVDAVEHDRGGTASAVRCSSWAPGASRPARYAGPPLPYCRNWASRPGGR